MYISSFTNSKAGKIVFILSIIISGYWLLSRGINIYRFALVGAIYEMLWLPALLGLFLLPIISLLMLIKEKIHVRSLYIYSILIGVSTILFLVL